MAALPSRLYEMSHVVVSEDDILEDPTTFLEAIQRMMKLKWKSRAVPFVKFSLATDNIQQLIIQQNIKLSSLTSRRVHC